MRFKNSLKGHRIEILPVETKRLPVVLNKMMTMYQEVKVEPKAMGREHLIYLSQALAP